MNIQQEELGNSQVQLTIEVEPKRLEAAKQKAARKFAGQVNVPGFRKGKAPYHMVLRTVGEQAILEEAIDLVFPEVMSDAVQESGVRAYSFDDLQVDIANLEPLTFRVTVPLMPTVRLGTLEGIAVTPREVTVEEARVDEALEELRKGRSVWEPTLGPSAYGDQVTLDMRLDLVDGTTVADEKAIEFILSEDEGQEDEEEFDQGQEDEEEVTIQGEALEEDLGPPPPPISHHLVGMLVNQVKEFPVVYPESWPEERLAGRTVLYRATLLDLKRPQEVALDDEFAQSVSEFQTLDALRDDLRRSLAEQGEQEEFNRVVEEILDALVVESDMEYPEVMVRDEVERRIGQIENQLSSFGMDMERYLQVTGQSREEMADQFRDPAEQGLRRSLVLAEYVRANDITATDEEMEWEMNRAMEMLGPQAGNLRAQLSSHQPFMDSVVNRLLSRKAVNHLYRRVTGEPEPALFPERDAAVTEGGVVDATATSLAAGTEPLGLPALTNMPAEDAESAGTEDTAPPAADSTGEEGSAGDTVTFSDGAESDTAQEDSVGDPVPADVAEPEFGWHMEPQEDSVGDPVPADIGSDEPAA